MATAPKDTSAKPAGALDKGDKVAWNKAVVILNVVLIAAVAIAMFRYTRPDQADDPVYQPAEPVVVTDPATSSAEPSPSDGPSESGGVPTETQAPPPVVAEPPVVKASFRADFTKGDPFPYGAGPREYGAKQYDLGVVNGLMVHGAPEGPETVSWLEKWTGGADVRRIGARVLFAPNSSGGAAITAWHTSVLETTGLDQPRTGMRLVADPRTWKLVVLDGSRAEVIGSGTFTTPGRSASFDLVRKADTVWVTDPVGVVSSVTDERIASLSGPWAGWELRETGRDQRPAALQEIWAG